MKRREFLKLVGAAAVAAAASDAMVTRLFAPVRARASGPGPKVICLGLDGMDPQLLRRFLDEGLMPNFARAIAAGGFRSCGTSIPPQSPVAWSNFITGTGPGGHGIFDFIHRDPATLTPHLSISEARPPQRYFRVGDWKLPRDGGSVELLRRGRAFWQDLAEAGVDVTIFKMPSNFPPAPAAVRSISGMGTPDILGTYGIFTLFTDDPPADMDIGGGRVVPVSLRDNRCGGEILGPPNSWRKGDPDTAAPVSIVVDPVNPAACIEAGGRRFVLQEGEWSDWVTLRFPMVSHLKEVSGVCRFYLMEARPRFRLYVTPVQIDPADPAMPISTPDGYARELAEAMGPFFTQGLPDDTKALDEGVFADADYVSQSDLVLAERRRQYAYELERFRGLEGGFLFFYFNTLDQNCHMFWRHLDPASPQHAAADPRFANRIRDLYREMDRVMGDALDAADERTVVFAVSDHGFASYNRSFHVNRWLLENDFLALRPGTAPEDVAYLSGIDWRRTRAYALGINSLYLNLRGREMRGVVNPGREQKALLAELQERLEDAADPATGVRAIKHAYRADQVFAGPQADKGCDLVLGYDRGFRGSNESALGEIPAEIFGDNGLKWSGDHCMAADEVPGILVCNRPLGVADPALTDMAPTFLRLYGLEPPPVMKGRDVLAPAG